MSEIIEIATNIGLDTEFILIGDSVEEIIKYIVDQELKNPKRMICELFKRRELKDEETKEHIRHSVSIFDKRIEFSRVHYERAAKLAEENDEKLNKYRKDVKLTNITPKVINEWCKDQISNKEIGHIDDRYFVIYNKETGNFKRFCIRQNRAFTKDGKYSDKIVFDLTTIYRTGFC